MRQRQASHPAAAAFTLVEMAIVLAIIGLLIGAVMAGSQMFKQSELQSVISDYTKYTNAVAQFRQQYGGWPGDLIDATNFWGKDTTNCNGDAQAAGTPGTCNGDSNGDMSDSAEPYRAWQHLMLAKLVEGNFTGVASGGGAVPGTNVPKGRLLNSGWSFFNNTAAAGNANWYSQDIGNMLAFGAPKAGDITQGAMLSPPDASQVDRKVDDGTPAFGRVVALKPAALANCTNTYTTDAAALYNITFTGPACALNMSLTTK